MNLNQFEMNALAGRVAMRATSGILDCVVSANQATALSTGAKVTLDTSADKNVLTVIAAATGTKGLGIIVGETEHSTFTAGMHVQVALFTGPGVVVNMVSDAAIAAMAYVELTATAGHVITKNANLQIGIALDAVSITQIVRVLITGGTLPA